MGHSGGGVALYALAILTIAALVSSVLLWQRVTNMQEQLARQSADSGTQAVEARTIASRRRMWHVKPRHGWPSQRRAWARWHCSAVSWKNSCKVCRAHATKTWWWT